MLRFKNAMAMEATAKALEIVRKNTSRFGENNNILAESSKNINNIIRKQSEVILGKRKVYNRSVSSDSGFQMLYDSNGKFSGFKRTEVFAEKPKNQPSVQKLKRIPITGSESKYDRKGRLTERLINKSDGFCWNTARKIEVEYNHGKAKMTVEYKKEANNLLSKVKRTIQKNKPTQTITEILRPENAEGIVKTTITRKEYSHLNKSPIAHTTVVSDLIKKDNIEYTKEIKTIIYKSGKRIIQAPAEKGFTYTEVTAGGQVIQSKQNAEKMELMFAKI